MSSSRAKEPVPTGFKSWKEFNEGKKKIRKLKQDYLIKKLEKQKQRENEKPVTDAKNKKICGEPSTLSIAVPGSILDNAQSVELRTYLSGQIARAACVYKVDEIIVYDDVGIHDSITTKTVESLSDSGEVRPARRCCAKLARILQFLECPQYLRKDFFPKHKDLEYAGLLNPLDAPHHMRMQDDGRFREGVVLAQPAKNGSYVNVGLLKQVKVNLPLQPGIRVTVEMLPTPSEAKRLCGRVVPPTQPQKETGIYWGYSVRLASSLNAVFTECPYKEGYDVTIGTSERGNPVETVRINTHHHALVVFGGLAGIEAALEADDILTVDNPAFLFDHYLNTCPNQGSRTIRTEEALLITLAELRTKLKPKVPVIDPSNTAESDDDFSEVSDSGNGDDLEDDNEAAKNDCPLDTSKEEANKGDQILNSSSTSCIETPEPVKKRKKNSAKTDTEESGTELKKIKTDMSLDSDLNKSTEIDTKLKEKKKRNVYILEETDESMNVTSESLAENTPSGKRKKNKNRPMQHEVVNAEVKVEANSSIESNGVNLDTSKSKKKKDKRKRDSLVS